YRQFPEYRNGALPHVEDVRRWLDSNIPENRCIGLIHGDFQFPNIMFSYDAPKVSGVIDWELSSLGDPLLDLCWVLASWIEPGDPTGKSPFVVPWTGFPTRRELVQLYGEITGRDMSALPWFFTLACFKQACILEGSYARALSGQASLSTGERLHRSAIWLLRK